MYTSLSHGQNVYIENALSVLTSRERSDLKSLFEHFFFFDQFSYPLFGTKPMSIGRLLPTDKARSGWEVWKKITPLFSSDKFIIRESKLNESEIVLIANLDAIESVYYENKDLFEKYMTLDELKASFKQEGPLFQELIHDHLCLGVLLGYGRRNAELFTENQSVLKPFCKWHPVFYYFSSIAPVYFGCDPDSEETKALKKRYDDERSSIVRQAKNEDIFVRTLALLSPS